MELLEQATGVFDAVLASFAVLDWDLFSPEDTASEDD